MRPILPSPDPHLNLFPVLQHQVAVVNAAPCGPERYVFTRLTNKGTVTKDPVGVQYGERLAKRIREILKGEGVMKHITPKGFGRNAVNSRLGAIKGVMQLEHSNYVGVKASVTEHYYKQSEASHLKCAAVLCGAAETTEQEQQCAPLPATTVHVAKAVHVTETKPVRSVQTSPPPVASLSMSMHTGDVKVGSCSMTHAFSLKCHPYGDPFQPSASPMLAASDVDVMLTPAAPIHAHAFKLFSSPDIAKMTQRRKAKRRRFVINETPPVQKKPDHGG